MTPQARALSGTMIHNHEVLVHGRLLYGAIIVDGGAFVKKPIDIFVGCSVSLSEKTSDEQPGDRSAGAELEMNAGSGSETVKRPIETCPTSNRSMLDLLVDGWAKTNEC